MALIIASVWTSIAAVADGAHIWSAVDAYRDLQSLKAIHVDGTLRFTAKGNIALSSGLAIVQTVDLLIGIASICLLLFVPLPPRVPEPLESSGVAIIFGWLIQGGLVFQELGLMAVSLAIMWFRHELRRRAAADRTKSAAREQTLVDAAAGALDNWEMPEARETMRRALGAYQGA